jgi:hypothetical protein
MGPIEETLKNELENIVRDAQDTLTKTYLGSVELADPSSGLLSGLSGGAQPMLPSSFSYAGDDDLAQPTHPGTGALSQVFVPPYATLELPPEMAHPIDNFSTGATWSDSAYYSLPEIAQDSFMNDVWLNSISNGCEDEGSLHPDCAEDTTLDILGHDSLLGHYPPEEPEEYTGKGKGRFHLISKVYRIAE